MAPALAGAAGRAAGVRWDGGSQELSLTTTVTARAVDLRAAHARARRAQRALTAATFAGIYVVLVNVLHLDLVFAPTTAAGGDMGSHHYVATFLRTELLPDGQVTGWAPGWYAGIPMLTFYFPLPYALIAAASPLLGAQVAFKLVSAAGLLLLPVCTWAAFRVLRLPDPAPLFAAVASIPFLFMTSYQIYGGNIASTMAGEFPFSFSFSLLPLALAMCWRVVEEGRGLTVTALLVTAVVLSHILTTIMLVLAVLMLLVRPRLAAVAHAVGRLAWVFGLAFFLTAFWALPFIFRVQYTAHFQWTQLTDPLVLAPPEIRPYLVLSVIGLIVAIRRGERRMLLLAWPVAVGVLVFGVLTRIWPEAALWNARMLPFIYLFSMLLAAYGATVVAGRAAVWLRRVAGLTARAAYPLVVVTMVAVTMVAAWAHRGFLPYWAEYNYAGFQAKSAWPEAEALFETLDQLPPGRVMWEFNRAYESFGTTRTLENIPVFTSQPTMEGLLIESSLNAPFHFINQAETSETATHAVPGLDYPDFDFEQGLAHLRLYGVRYFVAITEKVKREAEAAGLPVVGRVSAPRMLEQAPKDEIGTAESPFVIYEIGDGHLVEVPPFRPVMTDDRDWRNRSLDWYHQPDAVATPLVFTSDTAAADDFAKEPPAGEPLPREPLEGAGPVDAHWDGDERLEFTTDQIGKPHVVKVSWFPNWQVDGAEGPWMLSPGRMVVVPTQAEVTLSYRDTPFEITGKAMTATGLVVLAGTAVLWTRRRPLPALLHRRPLTGQQPDPDPEPDPGPGHDTGEHTSGSPAANRLRTDQQGTDRTPTNKSGVNEPDGDEPDAGARPAGADRDPESGSAGQDPATRGLTSNDATSRGAADRT